MTRFSVIALVAAGLIGQSVTTPVLAGSRLGAAEDLLPLVRRVNPPDLPASTVERRIAELVGTHGEELVAPALRKVGGAVLDYGQDATGLRRLGEHGEDYVWLLTSGSDEVRSVAAMSDEAVDLAIRHRGSAPELLATFGEDATRAMRGLSAEGVESLSIARDAILGTTDPRAILALVADGGDDAARFCRRERERLSVEGLAMFQQFGEPGGQAALALKTSDGRAALVDSSEFLKTSGRSEQLLAVVERHGDRAAEFIWRNRKGLAVTAALTAFLAEPDPFLQGVEELGGIAIREAGDLGESAVNQGGEVLKEVVGQSVGGADRSPMERTIQLALLLAIPSALVLAIVLWRTPRRRQRTPEDADRQSES